MYVLITIRPTVADIYFIIARYINQFPSTQSNIDTPSVCARELRRTICILDEFKDFKPCLAFAYNRILTWGALLFPAVCRQDSYLGFHV